LSLTPDRTSRVLTRSLFRHTLTRVVLALLAFELLVGMLAFWLLMLPVLRAHAHGVAVDVQATLQDSAQLPRGFVRVTQIPADGGPSLLPFNLVFGQELQAALGQTVAVRVMPGQPGHYWFVTSAAQRQQAWLFDQTVVVGAWPTEALVAWMLAALLTGLLVSLWLAASLTRPIFQLRTRLHHLSRPTESASTGPPATGVHIAELEALQQDYLALHARISQSLEDRTTLLLGLAHDLSAPVSRLTMAVELQAASVSHGRQATMANDLAEMRNTIEQFLGAAGCLGSGMQQACSHPELLAWLNQRYQTVPGVQLPTPLPDLPNPPVIANRYAMERILVNLIDNALRHGGGSVSVTTHFEANALTIWVRDQGPGLPPDDIERLFRPFERHGPSGGSGLGLALSRLMAEQNGWTLTAHPGQAHGLLMQLNLPESIT
jgi:two-component system osmolarity sensor histidine kinase EnvZ